MAVDLLLGLQWGDEGKGKIVDVFSSDYDVIARFQGGPNAGHTLEFNNIKHVLHTIPSGIFHSDVINVVGNGVVIDPVVFKKELENLTPFNLDFKKKLLISRRAHLILPTHRLLDAASEASKGKAKIGSTLKGIGPAYMDKTGRNGLRIGDIEQPDFLEKYRALADKHESIIKNYRVDIEYNLKELETTFFEGIEVLKSLTLIDSEDYLQRAIEKGKKILAEGAQGSMLDIDFGTYPFVTSSTTTAAGACIGLGVSPKSIGEIFGIFKAYTTRVGSGPFPTELFDEVGNAMAERGHEFGATTGRRRRCGWLDLVALKYAIERSGVSQLIMMKADVLDEFEDIYICTEYEYKNTGKRIKNLPYSIDDENLRPIYTKMRGWKTDITKLKSANELPATLSEYIKFIERETKVPIKSISVGPDRTQTIAL